jgi:hypothetical protein
VRDGLQLTVCKVRVGKTTVVLRFLIEEGLWGKWSNVLTRVSIIHGLREGINRLIVSGVILLFDGSVVPNLFGPGVERSGPRAKVFNAQVVLTSAKTEETLFSPVIAPRVSNNPILLTILFAPADDRHDVVLHPKTRVAGDATGIIMKLVTVKTASNRTALNDLLHHVLLTGYCTVLINLVDTILGRNGARLVGAAISAHFHGGALLAIGVSDCLVNRAGLISDLVLAHPPECSERVTTVAAERGVLTRDKHLGSNIDVRPGRLSRDFNAVREDRRGCVSPARAAVLRNVLVADVGQVVPSIDIRPGEVCG